MYTVIPILIGVLISIARFVLWKQDTTIDRKMFDLLKKRTKRTLFVLSFWPVVEVGLLGIIAALFPEIRLGLILNSLIFCSIVLIEVLSSIVGYAAQKILLEKK